MIMRPLLACAALALSPLAAAPSHAQGEDPLARSRAGAIECFTPDLNARTCRAMSAYRFLPDGRIMNDAIVLIQNNPHIIMYVSSEVFVRDAMVCGRVERKDLDAAYFEVDGVRAAAEDAAAIREAIAQMFRGMGEICTRYTPDGDGATVAAIVDGVERPDLADRMIWIRPEDGFSMGAAETTAT
jgi:hypothetical protein